MSKTRKRKYEGKDICPCQRNRKRTKGIIKWEELCGKIHPNDDIASVEWKYTKNSEDVRQAKLNRAYQDYLCAELHEGETPSINSLADRWNINRTAMKRHVRKKRRASVTANANDSGLRRSKRTVNDYENALKLQKNHRVEVKKKDKTIQDLKGKLKKKEQEARRCVQSAVQCLRQEHKQCESELIPFHADEVQEIKQRHKKEVSFLSSKANE